MQKSILIHIMKVIVVCSQKGGTGKTTLTLNLAALQSAQAGSKVMILDLDPQSSCQYWHNLRPSEEPAVRAVEPDHLLLTLSELEDEGYTHVWLDFPPVLKKWVRKSLRYADLVLIPTRASVLDIASSAATLAWAKEMGTQVRWVINGAQPRSRMAEKIRQSLVQHSPVCSTLIHERVDFALSIPLGQAVHEFSPRSKATREVRNLHQEITDILS